MCALLPTASLHRVSKRSCLSRFASRLARFYECVSRGKRYVKSMQTSNAKSYAVQTATSPVAPFGIRRREPGSMDVEIDILFCGVCHSDLHTGRNEWHNTIYPCVPGHEIVGRVTRVGESVTKFKPGDHAAVGGHG